MLKKTILIILLLLGTMFSQTRMWWESGNAYNKSFEPINLPVDTTNSYVYFYGDKITTKVAKDSGGVSVRPYVRVQADSVEQITNRTFNSNLDGWAGTFVWNAGVASGGNSQTIYLTENLLIEGYNYRVAFDAVISAGNLYLYYGNQNIVNTYAANGHYTETAIFTQGLGDANLRFSGDLAFSGSIDNVTLELIDLIDSTYGYVHTLIRPSDTTTYYYSQSVKWVQKDKDTIWVYADADTATVYPCDITPTQFVFTDITNAEINTQYTSDSIIVAGLTCETTLTVDAIQPLVSSEYQINDGIWVSDEVVGVVDNGDEIKIKATTVGSYNGSIDIVASVNSVEDTLTITTKNGLYNFYLVNKEDGKLLLRGGTYAIKFKD